MYNQHHYSIPAISNQKTDPNYSALNGTETQSNEPNYIALYGEATQSSDPNYTALHGNKDQNNADSHYEDVSPVAESTSNTEYTNLNRNANVALSKSTAVYKNE